MDAFTVHGHETTALTAKCVEAVAEMKIAAIVFAPPLQRCNPLDIVSPAINRSR